MVGVSQVQEITLLITQGWRPYNNQPEPYVYESLGCTRHTKSKPAWFVRDDLFLCISCSNKCSLNRPKGFRSPLPIKYKKKYTEEISLSPSELVEKKHVLQLHEVAYCLNISYSMALLMVQDGRLTALKDRRPIRVRASDVKKLMYDFDE